jgi:hypothetical protein
MKSPLGPIPPAPAKTGGIAGGPEIVRLAIVWEQAHQQMYQKDLSRVESGRLEAEVENAWQNLVNALDTRPEVASRTL